MDPTANLLEQLALAHECIHHDEDEEDKVRQNAERLGELVIALDQWIRKAGFLPEPWGRAADGKWASKGRKP